MASTKIIQIKDADHVAESAGSYAALTPDKHHWQSDGLSAYPPKDPLVGQSQFFLMILRVLFI